MSRMFHPRLIPSWCQMPAYRLLTARHLGFRLEVIDTAAATAAAGAGAPVMGCARMKGGILPSVS